MWVVVAAADGVHRLALAGAGFVELGLQGIQVHDRQGLAGLDEVAFVDQDPVDPARQPGGDVDFRCFDPAVALDEAGARSPVLGDAPEAIGVGPHDEDDCKSQRESFLEAVGWVHGRSGVQCVIPACGAGLR